MAIKKGFTFELFLQVINILLLIMELSIIRASIFFNLKEDYFHLFPWKGSAVRVPKEIAGNFLLKGLNPFGLLCHRSLQEEFRMRERKSAELMLWTIPQAVRQAKGPM